MSQHAAAAKTQGNTQIEGVWRGQLEGQPGLTLNVSYEGGTLNGAILFYFIKHDLGKPANSTPGVPEPLINPQFDGTALTFAVSHRRAHPPDSLNTPPVHFSVHITGANTAELERENDASSKVQILKDAE